MEDTEIRNIDNAASCDDGHSVASGHLNSLLFTMLPAELRLKIYEEAFEGSTAGIVEFPWFIVENVNDCRLPLKKYMLRPSHHHQLLLACNAIYKEAMPAYWSRTVISMGGTDYCPGSGSMIAAIPAHARLHVQYITDVSHPFSGNGYGYEGWWFTKMLSHLSSLKTCRLVDMRWDEDQNFGLGVFLNPDILTPEEIERRTIDSALAQTRMGCDSDLLKEPFYSATVLQRVKVEYTSHSEGMDIFRVDWTSFSASRSSSPKSAVSRRNVYSKFCRARKLTGEQDCFINHTAEYVYQRVVEGNSADSNELSDEDGFRRAIRDAPPVPLRSRMRENHTYEGDTLEWLYQRMGRT